MITINGNNFEDVKEKLDETEILISRWDTSKTGKMLFQSSAEEVGTYMDAVEKLQRLMEHLSAGSTNIVQLIRAQRLMKSAMARLKQEFHKILLSISEPIGTGWESSVRPSTEGSVVRFACSDADDDGSSHSGSICLSVDRICESDMVPLDAVENLRKIAQRMAKSGYARECVRIFVLSRKSVLEESLYNLGLEKVKLKDVRKMEWKSLDEKIKRWILAAKIGIRVVLSREKRLCEDVFDGFDKMRDACFAGIAKESTESLFAFAEAVAATSRAPERMFRTLDLYEALADVVADIEDIYSEETCRSVQEQAKRIVVQLGEAVRRILAEIDNSIQKEKSKAPLSDGIVHPLTRYVMNYLAFLSDYKETLVNVFADTPGEVTEKSLPENGLSDPSAPLSVRIEWTVFHLLSKLHRKSDTYRDASLSHLFLRNNLHYVLQKVNGSELKSILGEEWLRKHWKGNRW